jgi:hypothetical protein
MVMSELPLVTMLGGELYDNTGALKENMLVIVPRTDETVTETVSAAPDPARPWQRTEVSDWYEVVWQATPASLPSGLRLSI